MKAILFLLFVTAAVINGAVVLTDNGSSDLTLGTVGEKDWILWSREVKKAGSWLPWSTVETTFNFELNQLSASEQYTITAVKALNKSPQGKGGFVKLVSGGVDSDSVSLSFTSQKWWKGIDFLVVIYGHVPN